MKKNLLLFAIFMVSCSLAFAQQHSIKGRVLSAEGSAIPFASVQVKGTTTGTNTDQNGNFSLAVPDGAILSVSFVGYVSKEVPVNGQATLDITLTPSATGLNELVVTALGIKREAREIGYATAQISNKELNQSREVDLSTGLTGKVSGLQINLPNNGIDPQTRITLRGNRSFLGNNQALIVINGVPMPENFNLATLNPRDVTSVNVLKGAVSAALYGSKASNGVLLITTDAGAIGKPVITVSNTTTFQSVDYLPKFQDEFSSYGGEFINVSYINGQATAYQNADGTPKYVPFENEGYGPPFSNSGMAMLGGPVLITKANGSTAWDTLMVPFRGAPNSVKDFFQTGVTNQTDLSYSSGDANSSFFMSAQHVTTTGIVPNTTNQRDNVSFNGTKKNGIFSAQYNVSYTYNTVGDVGPGYSQGFPIYTQVLDNPAIVNLSMFKDWQNNPFATVNGFINDYNTNPYQEVADSRIYTSKNILIGSLVMGIQPTSWLNISDRLGATVDNEISKQVQAAVTFAPWAIQDPTGGGAWPSALQKVNGADQDFTDGENIWNNDFLVTIDKTFGKFSGKLVAGANLQQSEMNEMDLASSSLLIPGFYNIGSAAGIPTFFQDKFQQREYAYYEDLTLGWNDFLFLNLTNRDEWNSVLAPSNQHYEYPSANLSFVFTDAITSLRNSRFLSYGKVYAGLTRVANISLSSQSTYGAYLVQNIYDVGAGFPYGGLGGYSLDPTAVNPAITPERTISKEGGLTLGFLDNRINFTGDYYHEITDHQTLTAQVSHATGYNQKILNTGEMLNEGIELDLNVSAIRTQDWKWDIGLHFANNINKVISVIPSQGINSVQIGGFLNDFLPVLDGGIYAEVGQPYPIIKVSDWERDPQGHVIVNATTGFPVVDHNLKNFGNTNPKYLLGINTDLSYKGFALNLVLDYRGGDYIMNSIGRELDFVGSDYHSITNGRQRIIFPNSVIQTSPGKYVTNTSVATYDGGDALWSQYYGTGIGSPYVTSAAFWKLREAALTYTLPSKFVRGSKFIQGVSLSLVGHNLIMLRPRTNYWTDPEFSEDNGNATGRTSVGETPDTRDYGFNVTFTF